jgi:ERCC4-type nuclease
MFKLIIDTRERSITVYEETLKAINYEIQTINVGDYSIIRTINDKIVVCSQIERKSLADFAASFKDGRALNKSKLLEFRKQTGCKLIYIIEGEQPTNPNTTFNNIPYKHIESSIFHMMFRDDILFLWSVSTINTAQILVRLIQSLSTLELNEINNPELLQIIKEENDADDELNNMIGGQEITLEKLNEQLKVKKILSDDEILIMMWCQIKGITSSNAIYFMKHITIRELFNQTFDASNIRTPAGKALSTKMKNKLKIDNKVKIKMLSQIPYISTDTAKSIIESNVVLDEETLKKFTPKKTVLASKATNIVKFLDLKVKI